MAKKWTNWGIATAYVWSMEREKRLLQLTGERLCDQARGIREKSFVRRTIGRTYQNTGTGKWQQKKREK